MNPKQVNITEKQLNKRLSSLSYKWTRWFQYTWVGEHWYNIKGGVPSLLKWIKIAWKDRDFDNSFIYDALKFKIENTANYIEKHKRSVGYKEDVKWMRICVKLIDKLNDEFYACEYLDYKKTEFRFEDIEGSDSSKLHLDTLEDNLDDYFDKYPLSKKKAIEHIKKYKERYCVDHTDRGHVAHIMGMLRHEKARKLLFSILYEKIETFWD